MPKYFISYSRDDSDFVLSLATQLRDHNIDLWLDQLDIQPGQRWDRSIEKAMKECEGMLVMLSPTSIESENVLDEISYAIEEGKSVVPVLIKSCTIPYRLRRLQYANFTDQYALGFSQLLNVLKASIEVPDFGRVPADTKNYQSLQQKVLADKEPPAVVTKLWNSSWRERLLSFATPAIGWFLFEFIVVSILNQKSVHTRFDNMLSVDDWGVYALTLNPMLVGILAKRDKFKNVLSIGAYVLGGFLGTLIASDNGDLFSIPFIYLAPVWGALTGVIIQRFRAK